MDRKCPAGIDKPIIDSKMVKKETKMFGMTRFCLTDNVKRIVDGNNLTFSGYTNSNKPFAITVKLSDANRWINGEMIQNCFHYLDTEDREILLTGNDNESWESMFGGDDADD